MHLKSQADIEEHREEALHEMQEADRARRAEQQEREAHAATAIERAVAPNRSTN